jgi:trigger factor
MEIAVEELSELTRKVTITVPAEDVRKELESVYSKLQKDVHLKGFRRGKVPRSILEKHYGSKVQAEVIETLVQGTYFDAIEQEGLDVVVHPEIQETRFADDGTFVYTALVDVRPVFEIKPYKGLEIERPHIQISELEIDEKIEALRRKHAVLRLAPEDHEVAEYDIVMVDFQGFHNDKALPQVHNTNYAVDIGTHRLGEEFEEQLIGLKSGESALYETTFPADYPNPIMAGKTIEFKVDVKEIKERVKPELDDEFAKDIDEKYTSLADLRAALRDELHEAKRAAAEGDLTDRIMDKLLELNDFPVPERAVAYEIQASINQTEENFKRHGLTLETAGLDREKLIQQQQKTAERRIKGDFILKKIAELEEIKVKDEDLERGFQRIAKEYRMSLPEVKKYFQRREELMPFMAELLNEKILQFLIEVSQIIDVEAAPAKNEAVLAE